MKSLHKLIHNLHPSEKRYIKLRFKANKSDSLLSDYFDYLSKQGSYDFQAFQLKFSATSPKVLQNSLRKLYDSILRHLRAYGSQTSSESVLQGMLRDTQTLIDKGMLLEAEKMNKRLLTLSLREETFHIAREGFQNKWNLYHLQGKLSPESTLEINQEMKRLHEVEMELEAINGAYRQATTLYYQYFFYKRSEETKAELLSLFEEGVMTQDELMSDKARMSYYEIHAMKCIIEGDIVGHHNVRRDQLKHLFTSEVFEKSYISKVLVLSNTFTYLKSIGAIEELKAYLGFMKKYFEPFVLRNIDGVLTEKYYDIYFQNLTYIQGWELNWEEIHELIDEFKRVSEKEFKNNNLLISRTYLSLAEVLILSGDFRMALKHLIEFQSLALDKKESSFFIESELHLLMVYLQRDKMDVFDRAFDSLRKRVRSGSVQLSAEYEGLFKSFEEFYKKGKAEERPYQGNKKWIGIYLSNLSGKKFDVAVKDYFDLTKAPKFPQKDELLLLLESLS